jgi:hypothetical protein
MQVKPVRKNMFNFWSLYYFMETSKLIEIIKKTTIGRDIIYDENNPDSLFTNRSIFRKDGTKLTNCLKKKVVDFISTELDCTNWGDKPLIKEITHIYLRHLNEPFFGYTRIETYNNLMNTTLEDSVLSVQYKDETGK